MKPRADGTWEWHESHVPSLNEAMDRDKWPPGHMLRVRELADAAGILLNSGAPVRVGAVDVVAYYKQFGRQLAELHRNGALARPAPSQPPPDRHRPPGPSRCRRHLPSGACPAPSQLPPPLPGAWPAAGYEGCHAPRSADEHPGVESHG